MMLMFIIRVFYFSLCSLPHSAWHEYLSDLHI